MNGPLAGLVRRCAVVGGAAALAAVALAAPASAAPSQLKLGDTGASVLCLQKGLNLEYSNWSTNTGVLALDSIFGNATKNAVNDHKAYYGLPQDGIFGKAAGDKMHAASYLNNTSQAQSWRNSCLSLIPHN